MTEKTLEQAIEIKRVIDRLRNKKEELEETRNLIFSEGDSNDGKGINRTAEKSAARRYCPGRYRAERKCRYIGDVDSI